MTRAEWEKMDNAYHVWFLLRHRGERIAERHLNALAKAIDAETVENCLEAIRIEFEPEDAEIMEMVIDRLDKKYSHETRRDRKIAENRKHYAQVCARQAKGV